MFEIDLFASGCTTSFMSGRCVWCESHFTGTVFSRCALCYLCVCSPLIFPCFKTNMIRYVTKPYAVSYNFKDQFYQLISISTCCSPPWLSSVSQMMNPHDRRNVMMGWSRRWELLQGKISRTFRTSCEPRLRSNSDHRRERRGQETGRAKHLLRWWCGL